jgi:hypothetical protein
VHCSLTMVVFLDLYTPLLYAYQIKNLPAPPKSEQEENVIRNTLSAIGVAYSHLNDDVLVPSHIEAERTRRILVSDFFLLRRDDLLAL